MVPVHAVKTYGGEDSQLHSFEMSALVGRQCSELHSGRFTLNKQAQLARKLV
jgi:hypothetical protein